ncbi:interleukin 12Ba [Heterodontus francisci]|uniref:interleukin 12Ba n=1 Tax=Heterodontus francisci TaxID=7792 RepID=UPI00355B50C8
MVGRWLLCLWLSSLSVTVRMAFDEKYTIVNKPNQLIHLSCKASPDQLRTGIHWRLDGVPLSRNAHANILDLEVTDRPDAGNYSCHLNNTAELLKHYYILIDVGKQTDKILKEANGNYITCEAERFSGNFTCFWSKREKAIFSASFHRKGWNGDSKDCVLTPCKHSHSTVQATCTDHTFSPYAEELRQITFTVEAATSKRYEKHTKRFYIRDILKPAAPKQLTTYVKAQKVGINWNFPDSWNSPHSYFPLLSKVDVELTSRRRKHKRQIRNKDTSNESLILCSNATEIHQQLKHYQTISCYTESPCVVFSVTKKQSHKIGRICVRVKELFFNSTWSKPCCNNHQKKNNQEEVECIPDSTAQ